MTEKKKINVSHVNIRLSITFLLFKILTIEVFAGFLIVFFHLLLGSIAIENIGVVIPGFNIPLFVVLVGLKTALTLYILMDWLNEYYEITPEFITHRKGIVFRYEEKYPVSKILIIDVTQSTLGKVFNYGTISVFDEYQLKYLDLYQIHNPIRYASVLEDLIKMPVEKIHSVRTNIFEREDLPVSVN